MSRKMISLCVLGLFCLVSFMEAFASPAGVTVTAYNDRVRFEAPDSIKELRVQLFALSGERIIDSGLLRGTALDWQLGNHQGKSVASGVYLYVMTFKNADGQMSKQLGKVALVQGRAVSQAPALTIPSIGRVVQLAHCAPGDEPFPCVDFTELRWRELLDADNTDNFRLQRRENSSSSYLTLLQLDIVDPVNPNGNLKIHQLCLGAVDGVGGDCRSTWPSGRASSGWVDDGAVVRLVTDTDSVGIGTASPTEKLSVSGNTTVSGTIQATGETSKIKFNYLTLGDLPDATTYHGMFAHVHTTASAYFAHAGAWLELQQRVMGTCAAGNAIRVVNVDGTVTCEAIPGPFSGWMLSGNSGTTPGTNFIGTSDNQALEFKVNNTRALRIEPDATSPNIIGGFSGNSVTGGVWGATISGGGQSGNINSVTATFGTVGGGVGNTASSFSATVGGGEFNIASNFSATVGGGSNNTAAGDYSFAVGSRAKNTDALHDGVFMFADSTDADFLSTAANEFAVRASGGYRLYSNSGLTAGVTMAAGASAWSSVSDRALKEHFQALDGRAVLHQLSLIPITEWNYKAQAAQIRHIGPMAQDFYAAFGLGESDKTISTIDADGIALISIQALYELSVALEQKDKELETKIKEIDALRARIEKLEKLVEALSKK